MKKTLAILALAGLAGCAASVSDRTSEKPYLTFQTQKSPEQYSNCLKTAWVTTLHPDGLDIAGGKRLVVASVTVDYVVDAVRNSPADTEVKAYFRFSWSPWHQAVAEQIKACA